MASEIKANKISPATGTAFTIGDSGDTFTLPSGGTIAIASGATITNSGTDTGFGGKLVQRVVTVNGTAGSGTTQLPFDTSQPTSSEGVDLSLDTAITPISATNKLLITVSVVTDHSVDNSEYAIALYQDSGNALEVSANANVGTGSLQNVMLVYHMTSGTTSSTTFKIRGGTAQAGRTIYWNRNATSATYFGGYLNSYCIIDEYSA
jgi:hypothetical protein